MYWSLDPDVRARPSRLPKIGGVARVLLADNEAYAHQLAENIGALVAELGAKYTHVLTGHTTAGKNFLPRVAALLDVAQISDIIAVDSPDTFKRPIYAGNGIATVKSNDKIKVISVRGTGLIRLRRRVVPRRSKPSRPCIAPRRRRLSAKKSPRANAPN